MLPYACIDSIIFENEMRVYYSTQSQDTYGQITRLWEFDRLERGQVHQSQKNMYGIAERNIWKDVLSGASEEDLRIDSEGNLYAPSEVLVTFVSPKFRDTAGPRKGLNTTYELLGSNPVEDAFGIVTHFNIVLSRSLDQGVFLSED
jgi:hypothetical protein